MDLEARPGLEARGATRLERAAHRGAIFVHGAEEAVRWRTEQSVATPVSHLHEAPGLRLATDAGGNLADRGGDHLGRSCGAQPRGVMGEHLHVVARSEAAGTAGGAVEL